MKYTGTTDGITYALPNLLLADKLRTYGQRSVQAETKLYNDLNDIVYMLHIMVGRREIMPEDLKQLIATDYTIRTFWARVPEPEKASLRGLLAAVGIMVPQ
jgi:hypothetical protein